MVKIITVTVDLTARKQQKNDTLKHLQFIWINKTDLLVLIPKFVMGLLSADQV